MTITAGTRFDHYEILAPLGAGGMGEVYAARDTRLAREVAIKVLPADFAKDADRLRRFEQEAHATSALNHPNILTVHDIGTHDGAPFIVAELLEGEELRAQLDHGALSIRKAIDYAQQIAAGLAAAHEKGVVHRDLKPENLFVTKDGRVKILDFGLAKLKPQKLAGGVDSEAPTLKPLTNPGVVLGTVGYMSPEQVRGQEADHRSDIFSFGMILYEMLSGRRAFSGASVADLMSAILKEEPPELSEMNAKISPALDKLVRRCLEKRPERRFHSAHDLGFALEALSMPSSSGANRTEAITALDTAPTAKRGGWRERIWMIAAGAFALLSLALGVAYVRRPAPVAEPLRLYVNPPERAKFFDWPAISPDGRTLAFVAEVDGKTQLWVRPLGATTARPLVEVPVRNTYPIWSPDGQFIAYFEQRKLKKIALAGGRPEIVCDVPYPQGSTWGREGVILFGGRDGIQRVSASGGAVTAATSVDRARGDTSHEDPVFLPDGRHFLYHIRNSDAAKEGIYLTALEGGQPRQLLTADARDVGVALNPADQSKGYLTFVRQGALFAQPCDFSRNELLGQPVRIAEQVLSRGSGGGGYSLAPNGTLILLERAVGQQLTWFDRAGKRLGTIGPPGGYQFTSLSPDGQRLAVGFKSVEAQYREIYLFNLATGAGTPFTFGPKASENPLWSPDGSRLVWASLREGPGQLLQKVASGTGQEELLWRSDYPKLLNDWSKDGRFILFTEVPPQTNGDIWVLPMEGERKPWPWLKTPASEISPKFFPDGKWVVYTSNASGRDEVYLQAFVPGALASDGKRQLSTNGGAYPQWRRDGRELYYISAEGKLMAAEVTPGAELKVGRPKELFTPIGYRLNADRGYVVTGDGQRFLFITKADEAGVPPFTVVLNWMAEVQR